MPLERLTSEKITLGRDASCIQTESETRNTTENETTAVREQAGTREGRRSKISKEKRQHGGNKSPPIDAAPTRLRHKCGRGRDIQKETPPYQGWYEIQRARCRARCREQSWVSRLQGRWFATAHYVGYVIGVEHAWQLIRITIRAWSEPGDIFDAPC